MEGSGGVVGEFFRTERAGVRFRSWKLRGQVGLPQLFRVVPVLLWEYVGV